MILVIDGREVGSLQAFFDRFKTHEAVPDYFGKNLDALDEVLGDHLAPSTILWQFPEASRSAMGIDFDRLADVLRDYTAAETMNDHEWKITFSR